MNLISDSEKTMYQLKIAAYELVLDSIMKKMVDYARSNNLSDDEKASTKIKYENLQEIKEYLKLSFNTMNKLKEDMRKIEFHNKLLAGEVVKLKKDLEDERRDL